MLTPQLVDTTLLHTSDRLAYGSGAAYGVPNGAPALNGTNRTDYFTGRSDNFDPTHLSTWPRDARLDPESIRVANDGQSVFISDEYGPYIDRFDRRTGRRIPEDLALVGFDDVDLDAHVTPPLTSIRQPRVDIGIRAGSLLINRIEGHRGPAQGIELPTGLVVRESCGARLRNGLPVRELIL